jgi:hypothetical protein
MAVKPTGPAGRSSPCVPLPGARLSSLLISADASTRFSLPGFGGVVVADPCAERANAARQIAHGFRYATCSDQDQDDDKHYDSSERD